MSAYCIIEKGTVNILGGFWTKDYDIAAKRAPRLGGIVTNDSWLKNHGIRNPFSGLTEEKKKSDKKEAV